MSREVEQVLAVGFVVLLVAGAFATTSLLRPEAPQGDAPESRRAADDFTIALLSGTDFTLSDHRGKTIILDFWATWCAPCEVQMPVLDALWEHRRQAAAELMIVGVSVDTDPPSDVADWVDERAFEYPIGLGDFDLAQRYGVVGYPSLFIIDPDGGIHTQHVGGLSRPELEAILNEIAGEGAHSR